MTNITQKFTQLFLRSQNNGAEPSGRRSIILIGLIILLLLIYPFLPSVNNYWIDVGFFVGIYVLLGLSLNIVLGEVGLFDLGHAAFYAIGAYTTGILYVQLNIPIIILLPLSAITAAAFAYIVTSPIIHLRGDYLCIVTIGIGEIVRIAALNNPFGLTNGANGITGIGNPDFGIFTLRTPVQFYYYVWILVGLIILGLINLQKSRVGRAWNFIREDEIAAEANGIDVRHYKLISFVLGAALAGLAGNIYASKMMIISPANYTFMDSVLFFVIVLLGGLGSIPGNMLGAAIVVIFPEIFRQFASYRLLFFGAALMIMMIFRPGGILPRRREGVGLRGLGISGIPIKEDEFIDDIIQKSEEITGKPTVTSAENKPLSNTQNAPNGVVLETQNLTMQFGGLVAVNQFDMQINQGKITSLIGPNGAGKTTLFNVITGIYRPTTGKVIFKNEDITSLKPHVVISKGIARTFQNIRLFPSLTCIENVMSGRHCHAHSGLWSSVIHTPSQKMEERKILDMASYRVHQVGLWEYRNELSRNLPYGKQRLLEIARALATSPSLLILDEPSSGLNDKEIEEFMEFLKTVIA